MESDERLDLNRIEESSKEHDLDFLHSKSDLMQNGHQHGCLGQKSSARSVVESWAAMRLYYLGPGPRELVGTCAIVPNFPATSLYLNFPLVRVAFDHDMQG